MEAEEDKTAALPTQKLKTSITIKISVSGITTIHPRVALTIMFVFRGTRSWSAALV